jgi:enoyl-CoA hydratase/carnithine racemase
VRVVVLRADGPHFSSGHDLGSGAHMDDLSDRGYTAGPAGDVEKWSELDVEMCLRWRQVLAVPSWPPPLHRVPLG